MIRVGGAAGRSRGSNYAHFRGAQTLCPSCRVRTLPASQDMPQVETRAPRAKAALLPRENRNRLQMEGLRKQVHHVQALQAVPGL